MLRVLALLLLLSVAPAVSALDLQAHRGGRGLAPENTLPAFANALSIGVDTLELDADITRDGVVVIAHDPSLNPNIYRGPDGKWLEAKGPAIHALSYEELSRYDVGRLKPGTKYANGFPEQKAVDGTRVPRLADLFALVKRQRQRPRALQHRDQDLAVGAGRDPRARTLHAACSSRPSARRGWSRGSDPVLRLAHARHRAA